MGKIDSSKRNHVYFFKKDTVKKEMSENFTMKRRKDNSKTNNKNSKRTIKKNMNSQKLNLK